MTGAWAAALVVVLLVVVLAVARRRRPAPPAPPPPLRLPDADPDVFLIRGFDFYVRLDPARRSEMLDALRSAVAGEGTLYDRGTHGVVLWHDFDPPVALMAQLSGELQAEVIWLSFQRQVDAFEFARWEDGILRRHLVYGCYEQERTWEKVEGDPEPWEAAALFDPRELERRIATARETDPEFRMTAEHEEELREIWRERRLAADSFEPNIIARDTAEAVAIAYGLPGWEPVPERVDA